MGRAEKGGKKFLGSGSVGLSYAETLGALYAVNPDGLLVAETKSLKILLADATACRMFGYSQKKFSPAEFLTFTRALTSLKSDVIFKSFFLEKN